jgi:hypothetical protein
MSFYGEHICEACFQPVSDHSQRCDCDQCDGEDEDVYFLVPPCCPGCPCGSFEEAHAPSPPPEQGDAR